MVATTEVLPLQERNDADRYVIIGMESITPLGATKEIGWTNLIAGNHGFVPVAEVEELMKKPGIEGVKSRVVAPVDTDFKIEDYTPFVYKERKFVHRSAELATIAMYSALNEAGLLDNASGTIDSDKVDPWRVSAYIGTAFAGAHMVSEFEGVKSSYLFNALYGRGATAPANLLNIRGEVKAESEECASSAGALNSGLRTLWRPPYGGESASDVLVVAGTESVLSPVPMKYFEALSVAVDTRDVSEIEVVSRALDTECEGLIFGEGAAALVITTLKKARELGISDDDIVAEVAGTDHYTHAENKTMNGDEGQVRVIKSVLAKAGVTVEDIMYINGHLTSTPGGDGTETRNTRQALIEAGLVPANTYYGSTKSSTGHNLGAAGTIEAIWTALVLKTGIIPPQRNLEHPISELEDLIVNMNWKDAGPLKVPVTAGMSNNFGFGGSAVSTVLKKFVA